MSEAPSFASQGWHRVRSHGWIALVECDRERDRSGSGLQGKLVYIDGEPFIVKAVERHLPSKPIRKSERIGLLVKEHLPSAGDPLRETERVLDELRRARELFVEYIKLYDYVGDAIKEIERLAALVRR